MLRRGRTGRPGLVGTMARTAVIAGTATAVSGSVAANQQAKVAKQQAAVQSQQQLADLQAQVNAMQAQQAVSEMPPPVAAGSSDLLAQLERLVELKNAGILSDAEFETAKTRLLAGA